MIDAALIHPKALIDCWACGEPRQIDLENSKPGEYRYLICARCGEVRIAEPADPDAVETHPKKAARDLYERSRYRGGKLQLPGGGA